MREGQLGPPGDRWCQSEASGSLGRYMLEVPPDNETLRSAVRASARMWEAAPDHITIPLHAATFRAALGECDSSIFLSGQSGTGKTEMAAFRNSTLGQR